MVQRLCWLFLVLLAGCQFFSEAQPVREKAAVLTQSYAKLRTELIQKVDYDLKFDLRQSDVFSGVAKIQFELDRPAALTLDFTQGEIQELVINGHPLAKPDYNGFYLSVPETLLRKGGNQIQIVFSQSYSKNGTGLYRFQDSQDGLVYLYSHFEPYWANTMFPCFDQPDLKATFTTEVRVPKGWRVISSNQESGVFADEENESEVWTFPRSARFSTYTYSLHAGHYQVWEKTLVLGDRQIPMRLFARQSMQKFIDANEWFSLTEKGIPFFEKYFSTPFPYEKYDQVIVPNFNSGAMENVAAVTFNEDRFVPRGEKNRDQARRLALTLYHELAHMWFGNLVTMSWWNDLWLNESFATLTAYEALAELTDFKEAWMVFNTFSKMPAYYLDVSPNTHPVVVPTLSTTQALGQFDAITYGKGASVLRQLQFSIGQKNYRKALANYFTKHATGNTTLADFMTAMSEASGEDLKQWQHRWLETSMVNQLEVHFTCQNNKIQTFEIYQTATQDHPMLRAHQVKVALFYRDSGGYRLWKSQPLLVHGETTSVASFHGQACPQIAYPNFEDQTYAKIRLDRTSLEHVKQNLVAINDAMTRGMIWADLWHMVRDGRLDMDEYLQIAEFNALDETHPQNLQRVLFDINTVLKRYYPKGGEGGSGRRQVWVRFFEQAYLLRLQKSFEDPSLQIQWFQSLLEIAETPTVLDGLASLLAGRSRFDLSFPLHQEQRWEVLAALVRNNHDKAKDLLEKELKRDNSPRAQAQKLYLQALWPTPENKAAAWKDLLATAHEKTLSDLRWQMMGLFPPQQEELQQPYADEFFSRLRIWYKSTENLFSLTYANLLVPIFCDSASGERLAQFMRAERKLLPFPLLKSLTQAAYENQRCQHMREQVLRKGTLPSTQVPF